MARIFLSIEGIKQDLKQGLTRLKSDSNYDPELGSIEEKYNLNKTQVQAVFKDPRLKGLKTVKPKNEAEIVFQEDVPSEPINTTIREDSLEESGISELIEDSNVTESITQPLTENNASDTDTANSF